MTPGTRVLPGSAAYSATGTRVGTEFQVNSHTTYNQFYPAIAGISNGGFVITWEDYSGTGGDLSYGIRARLFTDQGIAVGDEFRINSTLAGYQGLPQVSALPNGGFAVTWTELDDTGYDVQARIFSVAGAGSGATSTITNQSLNLAYSAGGMAYTADTGNDTLVGSGFNDTLSGAGGNDSVLGGLGRDELNGNLGNDTALGGDGADIVRGGQGDDSVSGGAGDDEVESDFRAVGETDDVRESDVDPDGDPLVDALGAVVFEMLTADQAKIARSDAAKAWADSGWGDFDLYAPIFKAAPQATIYGANLPRAQLKAAVAQGAASSFGAEAARYGLADALPPEDQAAREAEQAAAWQLTWDRPLVDTLDAMLGKSRSAISPRFEAPAYIVERRFAEGVAARAQIEDKLYSWKDEVSSNAVEVYISRLRAKLEPHGIALRSIRGFGYRLELVVAPATSATP